jgi:2-dehydropantoate 2-reductase
MKVCIYGAGAVGGYFGGRLAQTGHDVTFIARGRHLDAIVADGLNVRSIYGDFTIRPAAATDRPDQVDTVDVVLCCVQSFQVQRAAESMRAFIGPETVVIPLQNGVEAHKVLSDALGGEHVLPGLCKLVTMIDGPGRIRHSALDPYLAFGEMDGRKSSRATAIARVFNQSQGMNVHLSQNIFPQLWKKFMLIAPWGGIGALTRMPIGVIRSQTETRRMLIDSIGEVHAVAKANGIGMEAQAIDDTIGFIDKLPPDSTASMQRDIMDGRPSELHEQSGAVVRYGEKGHVPTPVSRFIYHSLLPQERQSREEIDSP